jgi:3-isopropylmalate/(R)-2-methylmalate dehydratase small subunit
VQPVSLIESPAVPFPRANIDTDQILPARFLQKPRRGDYGRFAFHDLRFRADGTEDRDFILNRPQFRGAHVLVANTNFACGSSRENAVWALYDYGFRAALAPSFGDIFFSNSMKNGLLPIVLPAEVIGSLLKHLEQFPGAAVRVDLPAQTVTLPDGAGHHFEIDEFTKYCLLNGFDELDYTLSRADEITEFERRRNAAGG